MDHSSWGAFEIILSVFSVVALALYWTAAYRLRLSGHRWNLWRTISFSSGVVLLLIALHPSVVMYAHQDLRGHMLQHLLIGMFAPLGLVFGAPVTLALRASSRSVARKLVLFLNFRFFRTISHPLSAMLLNIGGMYVLYLTPLYAGMLKSALLHALVHWHFLVAGCLFSWAIAGPDPAPRRPGKLYRLVIVFVSMATHGFLAKAMYAYGFPAGTSHTTEQIREAAKIMYYGGDAAELLLVIALFSTWFTHRRKERSKVLTLSAHSSP